MKCKFCWAVLGAMIAVLILLTTTFFTSYGDNIDKMLGTQVVYKHESVMTHLSADVWGYLTMGKKSLYLGELPSRECAIEINSPSRATLYVYPLDDSSFIVRYEPRNGIKRTYKVTGHGNFGHLLDAFYDLTGNDIFNGSVDY